MVRSAAEPRVSNHVVQMCNDVNQVWLPGIESGIRAWERNAFAHLTNGNCPAIERRRYFAAVTMISTLYCGFASLASTVARAGVFPADTQPSHTAFISAKFFMSVI
jgi:hypothetical protein